MALGDDLSFNLEAVMRARGSSDEVLEQLGCRHTPCGLEIPPGLSFEQWLTAFRELGKQGDKLFWEIGELWVYGEHRYGDRKALIRSEDWNDLAGVAYSTCTHAGTVVRAFPESCRRRQLLTPSHHVEVASLSPRMADALLDWAEEPLARGGQRRSVRALREEKRRRLEQLVRSVPTIEPTRSVAANLRIEPALEPEAATYALLRMPETPSLEPEVQQLLGPSQADVQRQRMNLFRAGLHYAKRHLPSDFTPDELEEAIEETKQLLDRLMKLRDQSGSDEWGDNVVNLR
jgi:hypothetical protein